MIELTIDDLEVIDKFDIPMTIIEIGGAYWGVVTAETFISLMLVLDDLD
jgi:hypothetical protein